MAKKKSKLKKALALGAALAGGLALAKNRKRASMAGMDDAGRNVKHFNHPFDDIPLADNTTVNPNFLALGAKDGGRITKRGVGIARRGFGRALKGK